MKFGNIIGLLTILAGAMAYIAGVKFSQELLTFLVIILIGFNVMENEMENKK